MHAHAFGLGLFLNLNQANEIPDSRFVAFVDSLEEFQVDSK